jgi:hypothetical protein
MSHSLNEFTSWLKHILFQVTVIILSVTIYNSLLELRCNAHENVKSRDYV